MRRFPVVSSDDVIPALKKAGFVYAPKCGKGSHIPFYEIGEKCINYLFFLMLSQ
jgi:predicted RNA binding protein YcfA (HicA-like mRNA interferase family)